MNRRVVSKATAPALASSFTGQIERSGDVEALAGVRDRSSWALTTSDDMFRIAARLVLSMRPNEQIIACTGIAADDPSGQFALNTGLALARLGHGPVLVVDANLRNPTMHDTIGGVPAPGLAELLQSSGSQVATIRATDVPNLLILPAGESAHLTPGILASAVYRDVFESFRTCRYVVMDIGPVLVSAESLIMASAADVIVAPLAAGRRTRKELLHLKEELRLMNVRFLGVVLTEME